MVSRRVIRSLVVIIVASAQAFAAEACPWRNNAVVRCAADGSLYKIVSKTRRQFSPEVFLASGSPAWTNVNCARLNRACPLGPVLPMPVTCPFADGAVVRCRTTGAIYLIRNKIRQQFSPDAYAAAGYPKWTQPNCNLIASCTAGPAVPVVSKPVPLPLPPSPAPSVPLPATPAPSSPAPSSPAPAPASSPAPASPAPSPAPAPSLPQPAGPCPFNDGAVVRCETSGDIFLITAGTRQQFSPGAYAAAGYPAYTQPGCGIINTCALGATLPGPAPTPAVPSVPSGATVPQLNDGTLPPGATAQYLGTSMTTYHYYAPGYQVSTTYCADAFAGKGKDYLLAYPWVAYCNSAFLGGMNQGNCGKCLRLTNVRTGAAQIVRIVDECGHNAIDSDWDTAFKPIDTDNQGYLDGKMTVKVELVNGC